MDLFPLGLNPLAGLFPFNEILADLVPPQKHLIIRAFFRKMFYKYLIDILAKLVLSKLVFLDDKLISSPVIDSVLSQRNTKELTFAKFSISTNEF